MRRWPASFARVLAAAALATLTGAGCGLGDGPPHVPVTKIFDARPNCGGDASACPDEDGGASPEAPPEVDAQELDAPLDAPPPVITPRACKDVGAPPATAGLPGTPTAKVLLVSVDGLRPDAIFYAPAPHLLALACRGSYTWRAQTIHPSITLPSHASMVSGFPPEAHKLFHNDLKPGYIAVPTVMSVAKAAGKKVVLVVGKEKMIQLIPPDTFDTFVFTPDLDDEVISKAIIEFDNGFDFMFVHLPMVDIVGHTRGWMSPEYMRQVATTDAALGRLLAVVPRDVTVMVTADHGGSGYIHWSGAPEDVYIPWIVSGPGVRRGHSMSANVTTFDTAATAAHILGLSLVPEATGKPVLEPWTLR